MAGPMCWITSLSDNSCGIHNSLPKSKKEGENLSCLTAKQKEDERSSTLFRKSSKENQKDWYDERIELSYWTRGAERFVRICWGDKVYGQAYNRTPDHSQVIDDEITC